MAFASTLLSGAAGDARHPPMTEIKTAIRRTQPMRFLSDASATKVVTLLLASRTVVSQCVLISPNLHASWISADTVSTAGHDVVAGFSPRSLSEHCVHKPAQNAR